MQPDDIYCAQGFGRTLGAGRRWALLIVDFMVGFNDPALFGGGNIDTAVQATRALLAFARRESLPVAHTRCVYAPDAADAGIFAQRNTRSLMFTETASCSQIVPELQPVAGELIVRKTVPSAFFSSPLAPWLAMRGVDTLLVAGCTTSGCVRASVVDAVSHNFRTIVVSDCVGDRALEPHSANLFDMQQKYADVVSSAEAIANHAHLQLSQRRA